MDEIILDLTTWHAAEHPDEHVVEDEGFDMAAELAAAEADADDGAGAPGAAAPHPAPPSGDGTLPPGAPLPDDFEEI